MSVFPAYSTIVEDVGQCQKTTSLPESTSKWLENSSFSVENVLKVSLTETNTSHSVKEIKDLKIKRRKKKKHKDKSKGRRLDDNKLSQELATFEFDGSEEYYVDKSRAPQFISARTLHKPACPRYRQSFNRVLGLKHYERFYVERKRYYKPDKRNCRHMEDLTAFEENEYTSRLGLLNRKTLETSCDLQVWLDLIALQDRNPYKWSRLMLAEKKLDLIQRALTRFPRNDQLYRHFIDIINVTYPSFEVTKMLDRLLTKDPYSFTLWIAQIMTTQGSMARCIVPDVLLIYQRCMSKMHRIQQMNTSEKTVNSDSDDVMLRLFNNCALFLRQAGLYEQFMALLKLALELNVSTDHFKGFSSLESDQNTLIDYEELVLRSGLPMNEIWLRVEKLRQCFNFLPCPEKVKCNDPQRIVFNEDVCHYIYPLQSRENSFYLLLLVLRLLKVPFIQCEGLAEKFSAHLQRIGDSDAIEDTLAVCLKRNFTLSPKSQNEFQIGLYTLAKEMAVGPTFLSNTIGHEIYIRCIAELLVNCAEVYSKIDERKRGLFILLWCRFQRLLMVLERCGGKISDDYIKVGRKRFKDLLKKPSNRNELNFYTEFAIYEFEALEHSDDLAPVQSIFENLITSHFGNETQSSDLCYTYVTYAEMLVGHGKSDVALSVLISYALSSNIKSNTMTGTGRKLAALQQITEKLERNIAIEQNVEVMVLEQYLLPDYTVSLVKLRILMQCLIGQRLEAVAYLDKLLKIFRTNNDRHRFLREHIQELYVAVLQFKYQNCAVPNSLLRDKLFAALAEFPRNLFLLQQCVMLNSVPWFRIRTALLHSKPTILSVTFLIVLARFRFIQAHSKEFNTSNLNTLADWDQRCNEVIVRHRILHIFKVLSISHAEQGIVGNALQRNALFWRLYIRCLSDQCIGFEENKKYLLTALDECPWSKALYLDGATYVPQELPHLQDLIIEKQLRIYALPEELEILREHCK